MSVWSTFVGAVQSQLSRSETAVAAAIKLREQCNSIIGLSLQNGINPAQNGELWLTEIIAPHASTFVDVGANVGEWSLMFARNMTKIPVGFAVEPVPETATVLRQRLESNGLPNVTVLECALGNTEGAGEIFAEDKNGETSSLFKDHSRPLAQPQAVKIKTLDNIMAEFGI